MVDLAEINSPLFNVISNINEVIRSVLNSLLFFTKRFCSHKKHQKHKDATKEKHKTLQVNKSKKMRLKASKGKKATYSLIYVFGLGSLSMQL